MSATIVGERSQNKFACPVQIGYVYPTMNSTRHLQTLAPNELGSPQRAFSETFRAASLFEKKYLTGKQIEDARRAEKGLPPIVGDGTHGE